MAVVQHLVRLVRDSIPHGAWEINIHILRHKNYDLGLYWRQVEKCMLIQRKHGQ